MSTDDSLDEMESSLDTPRQKFHKALICLVTQIELFAGQQTNSQLSKIPWLLTPQGEKSWDDLVKITFTKYFKVRSTKSNKMRRCIQNNDFFSTLSGSYNE